MARKGKLEEAVEAVEAVRDVLRRYFEEDDRGRHNKQYDPYYSAQDAIDDIHYAIGDI